MGFFVPWKSRYLSSRLFGTFVRNIVVAVWPVTEGVDGSHSVSGKDRESDVMYMGSFSKFGSPCENVCVIQLGSFCEEVGGMKGLSRTCWKVFVEFN